jgi:hypothetical protein
VQHGPVGIRCRECLQPVRAAYAECGPPQHISTALGAGAAMAAFWVALFTGFGIKLAAQHDLPVALLLTPNFLLSGLAGALVGWIIWRVCGRSWDHTTIWAAIGLAVAIPLLSTIILAEYVPVGVATIHHLTSIPSLHLLTNGYVQLRLFADIVISAAFSLLLTTQLHYEE